MADQPINGPAPDLAEAADLAEQLGAEPAQDDLGQAGGFRNVTTMDLLRAIVELHHKMSADRDSRENGEFKDSKRREFVSRVEIPHFDGNVRMSLKEYRHWRKEVQMIKIQNGITDQELTFLIYAQTGRAKQCHGH